MIYTILEIIWPVTGVAGTLLLAIKNKWGWWFYMVGNTAAIIVLIHRGLYIPISQYFVFMVLNVIGIINWFRKERLA